MNDDIVDEVRRWREEYAARFNYDLRAMVEDARRRQGEGGRKVVRRKPRPPRVPVTKEVSTS